MSEYENNPRYEKLDENVYLDTETDETVFLLSMEESQAIGQLIREQQKTD